MHIEPPTQGPVRLGGTRSADPRLSIADRPHRTIGQAANTARRLRQMRSAIGRWARQLWILRCSQRLLWTIPMQENAGICSFEITSTSGFLAQLNWCLFMLQYCELHELIPDLSFAGVYLDPDRGPNWLNYYFDISRAITSEEVARRVRYTKKLGDFRELGPPTAPPMSLEEGARIVHKYLRPKLHITALVDDFWQTLGVDGPVLGIHFRGTDETDKNIKAVFVASNEQKFIDFVVELVKELPVYFYDDHYRTQPNDEVPPYRGNRAAMKKERAPWSTRACCRGVRP